MRKKKRQEFNVVQLIAYVHEQRRQQNISLRKYDGETKVVIFHLTQISNNRDINTLYTNSSLAYIQNISQYFLTDVYT